jgi:hypothetical protein
MQQVLWERRTWNFLVAIHSTGPCTMLPSLYTFLILPCWCVKQNKWMFVISNVHPNMDIVPSLLSFNSAKTISHLKKHSFLNIFRLIDYHVQRQTFWFNTLTPSTTTQNLKKKFCYFTLLPDSLLKLFSLLLFEWKTPICFKPQKSTTDFQVGWLGQLWPTVLLYIYPTIALY